MCEEKEGRDITIDLKISIPAEVVLEHVNNISELTSKINKVLEELNKLKLSSSKRGGGQSQSKNTQTTAKQK